MLSVAFVPNTSTLQLSPAGCQRPRLTAAVAPPSSSATICAQSGSPGTCADPGDSDFHGTELLTGEPTHLVELVDAHVDEDATTTRPELQRRGRRVPLIAADRENVPELAASYPLAEFLELGHEPAPVSHLQRTAGLFSHLRALGRLRHGQAAGLLAQHRKARSHEATNDLEVSSCRRRDKHTVELTMLEHLLEALKGANAVMAQCLARVLSRLRDTFN